MNELERMKKLSDDLEYWRQRAYEAYDFLAEKEKGIAFWKKIAKGWEQSRDKWFEKAKDRRAALKRQQTSRVARLKETRALQKQVEEAERSAKNWEKEAQRYAGNSDHWQERLDELKRTAEWLKDTWSEFDKPINPECELKEPLETLYTIAADWYSRLEIMKRFMKTVAAMSATHRLSDGSSYGCGQCFDIIDRAKDTLAKFEEMKADCWTLPEGATYDEKFSSVVEPNWKLIAEALNGCSSRNKWALYAAEIAIGRAVLWLKERVERLDALLGSDMK